MWTAKAQVLFAGVGLNGKANNSPLVDEKAI